MNIEGNGSPIECCTQDATNAPPRYRHPACAALIASVSDDDYIRLPSCLNYVRSAIDVNVGCKFGPAQQVREQAFMRQKAINDCCQP